MSASNSSLRADAPGVYSRKAESRQARRARKLRYKDSAGKWRFKWVAPCTLAEAKQQRDDLNVSIRRREVVVRRGEAMRWPEAVEGFRQVRKVRRPEKHDYVLDLHVNPLWKRLKVADITPHMVEKLLARATRKDGRDGPLNDGTKAQILNVICQVFDYALEERAIPSNPARQIRKDRKPRQGTIPARTYSPDEQKRLLAYCGRFPWLRPIIEIAVLQAFRLGEVLALRPKDVDFQNGKLTVLRQLHYDGSYGPPKGWTPQDDPEFHIIDLNPEAAKILRDLTPDSAEKPYFRNTLGEQRAKADASRAFRKARKYAGLSADPRLPRFHDLRHTAISRLANAPGAQIPWVQHFARHKKIETTYGYVHEIRDEKRVRAAWEALKV